MKKSIFILVIIVLIAGGCGGRHTETTNTIFMNDTIFINQSWDIDNLKFGQSDIADFKIFRKNLKIKFKESRHTGHADASVLDSEGNEVGMTAINYSSVDFQNDKLGLSFVFSASWEQNAARQKEVLQSAKFEKQDKLKFYNGINFQSSAKDVINAFGTPESEWETELFYSFENVTIFFVFQDNNLFSIEIQKK